MLIAGSLAATIGAVQGMDAAGAELGSWGVDLEGRNLEIRAQDDFFRHAGGTWLDEFEIPADLPAYGSFTALFLKSEAQVLSIIQELSASEGVEGTDAKKIADLYNAFMDESAIEAKGLKPLEEDFGLIGKAKTHEEIARLLALYARLGGGTPFGYYIDQDPKLPSTYIPIFTQGGIGLPDRDYYLDAENPRFVKAMEARRTYLITLLTLAGHASQEDYADRILALETGNAAAHWPSEATRDVEATYNKMTVAELGELAPEFPWTAYLGALGLAKQNELIISAPSAYVGMAKVFADTPVDTWQAYLTCTVMGSHAAWLPKEVDDAQFRFVSDAITGSKKQRDREKRGVQFVNGAMGEALGRIYVERHFSEHAKERMDVLVDNLLVAMGERIDGLEWMSDATKAKAQDKLSKFTVKIGYPDNWRNYWALNVVPGDLVGNGRRARLFEDERNLTKLGGPVDRTEWYLTPQTVNAYYNPAMNEIVFPAAILQPPFFGEDADDAVNYGAIGAVIGHEIGHGFDDQGRKSDGDGIQQDWWTEEDARRFQERADLLVAQYDAFVPLEGMNVNGQLTLGENIGDVGGLEIAYHAYKLSLGGKEAPVLDGLTGDQRFFLGYAQIWRGKMREELLAMLVASNPHSPEEFRVNGAVANMDAWYKAFQVEPGDAMYRSPDARVRIW